MWVINIFCINWDRDYSYGRIAREMSGALRRLGYTVNRWEGKTPMDRPDSADVNILLGYPTIWDEKFPPLAQEGAVVALTMWESTILPKQWAAQLNKADLVIVPCTWNRHLFHANGVTSKIVVVPLGISDVFMDYKPRSFDQRPLRFLATGTRGYRKGWHIVGWAFVEAFGDDPDYQLIYKATPEAMPFHFGNKNITIERDLLSDAEMKRLYQSCDFFINPNCGEGFGFMPREFAATGGITLTTNYGGTADHLSEWGWPINAFSLEPAWRTDPDLHGIGEWALVDHHVLATELRNMAHPERAAFYRMAGERVARMVHQRYSWSRISTQLVNCLGLARSIYQTYRNWAVAGGKLVGGIGDAESIRLDFH